MDYSRSSKTNCRKNKLVKKFIHLKESHKKLYSHNKYKKYRNMLSTLLERSKHSYFSKFVEFNWNNIKKYLERNKIINYINPKTAGGSIWHPCGFSKYVSSKERVKPWFFVTFNIILKHIFPENFIEFSQVFQKIWGNSLSILDIFINFSQFSDFLTLPCYKETNDFNL